MAKKVDPQIRVMNRDLQDLIRDKLYGYMQEPKGKKVIKIPVKAVKKIAKEIAARAIIGH
jgi:hypothetical protein